MQTSKILRQAKWLGLLACCLISISAKAPEWGITPFQREAESFSDNTALLIGHWRKTVISYGSVWDEHLVFHPEGTVENWIVTVSSRGAVKVGNWSVEGKKLNIDWGDKQSSRLFTFHNGGLVLPNIPNARKFWDRVR